VFIRAIRGFSFSVSSVLSSFLIIRVIRAIRGFSFPYEFTKKAAGLHSEHVPGLAFQALQSSSVFPVVSRFVD
jgi:hypothetical protein